MTDTEVAINTEAGLWRIRVSESGQPRLARITINSPSEQAGINLLPYQLEELSTSLAMLAAELRLEVKA
jgi:hypothetical protein